MFLDKRDQFRKKMKNLTTLPLRKFQQQSMILWYFDTFLLFSARMQEREIYPELKCFYKEHSNVTGDTFLTAKFG